MILVVNAGSSSIKFKLFNDQDKNNPISILDGLAERIGIDGVLSIEFNNQKFEFKDLMPDHKKAVDLILDKFKELKVINDPKDINAIGFRTVHGGEQITKSVLINDEVKKIIENNIKLAPLHNPGSLIAINAFEESLKHAKLVSCFDTSFHQTMPEENYIYPVPYEWYEKMDVRKYGMHGISYDYITVAMSEILKKDINKLNLIVCHLGNGASASAIKNGKSIDTTMGLTPLAGLMMGTRSGDIDPSIISYVANQTKKSVDEITNSLNKESGLLGLSGVSSDMRDVISKAEEGNERSKLAIKIYSQHIADFIVKFANKLEGNIDAIIFTAGIGENSSYIREKVIEEVKILDLKIDKKSNSTKYSSHQLISEKNSKYSIYAVRTNEEMMICLDTIKLTK